MEEKNTQKNLCYSLFLLSFVSNYFSSLLFFSRHISLSPPMSFLSFSSFSLISSDKDMVKRSFDVCGITTSDPAKVRSGSFYDKCMRNAESVIEANELEDEDPFEL